MRGCLRIRSKEREVVVEYCEIEGLCNVLRDWFGENCGLVIEFSKYHYIILYTKAVISRACYDFPISCNFLTY